MEVVTLAHELNIGTINGMSVEEILDMMVDKGIGIANPGVVFPTQPALGGIIDIGDYEYRIVEINNTTGIVYVALAYWQEDVRFNSSAGNYNNSIIANRCTTWYNDEVPQNLKDKNIFIDVNTEGVIAPCFVPSHVQVNPDQNEGLNCFDYYRESGSRIFRDKTGTAKYWWTSTRNYSDAAWCVTTTGTFSGTGSQAGYQGFRPHLAIAISAFASGTVSA